MDYSKKNPCVSDVELIDTQLLQIKRSGKSNLNVHVTNIYIVSETDVEEILLNNPEVNCIVTVSTWNSYTVGAKVLAESKGVALFKFKEFLGALYYDGKRFIEYYPPERDKPSWAK